MIIKKMSNSNYAAKRSAIQASFDDKVTNCVEDIVEFSSIIKNIHDISDCDGNCEVGYFSDELYHYLDSKRHSLHLIKKLFLYLYKKYPTGFHDNFLIAKNKDFALGYFSEKKMACYQEMAVAIEKDIEDLDYFKKFDQFIILCNYCQMTRWEIDVDCRKRKFLMNLRYLYVENLISGENVEKL